MHYLEDELFSLLQNDKRVLEFLITGSLDGIWYWDLEQPENEYMSAEFWQLFGVDPESKAHLAAEWQDIIYPEDLETALRNFERHVEDPSHPYDQIVRYRHSAGHTVTVRCRGIAIRDETGKPVRLLGAHTDMTALKRSEDALVRANHQLLQQLTVASDAISVQRGQLSNMSHEVRTPLNVILGLFHLIESDPDTPEHLQGHASIGLQAAQQLLDQVVNALELSRLDSAELEITRLPTQIADLVREWEGLLGTAQVRYEKTLDTAVECADGLNASYLLDGVKLSQIVGNLIDNAVKFTEAGQVVIRIAPKPASDPEKAGLSVTVLDTGPGIAEGDRERLFGRFVQADDSTDTAWTGAGLGLAISRELASAMGGTLVLLEEAGPGFSTAMQVVLPAKSS